MVAVKPIERENELVAVADGIFRGKSYREIAQELGTDAAVITGHVARIRGIWRAKIVELYNGFVLRELEKLDRIEDELWEAWEQSKSGVIAIDKEGNSEVVAQPGDVRIMDSILKVMADRAKRLGLYDFDISKLDTSTEVGKAITLRLPEGVDNGNAISAIAEAVKRGAWDKPSGDTSAENEG